MTTLCFWIIPIFGALIGAVAAYVCSFQLRIQLKMMLKGLQESGNEIVTEKLEEIIDLRLDKLITTIKEQIPMASMLLGQAREDQLKHEAREELLKAVPSITDLISSKIPSIQFTDRVWRSMTNSLMMIAALTGVFLGLIELGLLMLFC